MQPPSKLYEAIIVACTIKSTEYTCTFAVYVKVSLIFTTLYYTDVENIEYYKYI